MKTAKFFFPFIASLSLTYADEPPTFDDYQIQSADHHCTASISLKDTNGKKHTWEWTFQIQVYKGGTDTALWSCDYLYDGYQGGILSDDGSTFVYVSDKYEKNKPVVFIYQNGKLAMQLKGEDLNLDKKKMKKSVTSEIWLVNYKFISTKEIPFGLGIDAVGQKIVVNLQSFLVER